MKKRKPHYSLSKFIDLINKKEYRITTTAVKSGYVDFDLNRNEIADESAKLKNSDFYKSMTSHADHTIWQDVYRKKVTGILAYIKIQIIEGISVIISFKKKDNNDER